jgi:hypothetical protein
MINRRRLFSSAAIGALTLGLGACASQPVDTTLATVAADVNTIAAGLKGVLTQLGTMSIAGLTPAIVSTVGTAIANIQSVAAAVSTATTTAAVQPLVQKIETYLNAVISALAAILLRPPISTALQAAAILLPVVEAAIGLVTNAVPMQMGASAMTADQARLILRGNAALAH